MKVLALVTGLLFMISSTIYASTPRMSYDRLEQLFLQGQFASVVSEADALIRAGYGPKDEIYYLKGLSELKLNKFDAARESFKYIAAKYPGSRKTFDARIGIGDSYMLAGDLNSAVGIYIGLTDEFRTNKNLPIIYSRLASCYRGLGVRDKAEYYKKMAGQTAPLSFEAKAAPAAPKISVPSAPVSNIQPKDTTEVDVILATGTVFSVQVGSFKNRRNAEKIAQKLSVSGYESRIEIPVAAGDKIYRVKVGRMSSKAEAEALKTRLEAAGYTTKICDGQALE